MIDFENKRVFKLSKAKDREVNGSILDLIEPIMVDGEEIVSAYSALRDFVVFTDRRIIAVNVQGVIGSKKDFTTLPYSKIQSFSIETAGTFDLESELELYFSSLGIVRFEFSRGKEITQIAKTIAEYVL